MDEKLKAKLAELNRKWKAEKFIMASDITHKKITTGSLTLDEAIGGGLPMGHFVMFWGAPSTGKSTTTLWTLANAQKAGLRCLYIDAEKRFEPEWARQLGVDTENLPVLKENHIEKLLESTTVLVAEKLVDVIVLDSINGVNYTKYYEENNGSIGLHSKAIGELINKINSVNTDTLIILISQLRNKFGKNFAYAHHSGGFAAEHDISLSIRFHNMKDSYVADDPKDLNTLRGKWVDWEVPKNSFSIPLRRGRFLVYTDGRIDVVQELITLGLKYELIEKSGNWLKLAWDDQKINGQEAFGDYLNDNIDRLKELRNGVLEKIG